MTDIKITEDMDTSIPSGQVTEEDSKINDVKITEEDLKTNDEIVTVDVEKTDFKTAENKEDLKMADVKVTEEDLKTDDEIVTEDVEKTNAKATENKEDLDMADVKVTEEDLKTASDEITEVKKTNSEVTEMDTKTTNDKITEENSKTTDFKATANEEMTNVDGTEKDEKMSDVKVEEQDLKPLDVNLDKILEEIGLFGKYQLKYFFLLALPVILNSVHANNFIFAAQNTKLRCKTICDGSEVEFDPPWLSNATFDRCNMFTNISSNVNIDDSCPSEWFDQSSKIPCEEYVFIQENTLIEEIGIACEDWKRTLIGTIHSVGTLFALPIIGYISDRFGRKFILILSCILEGSMGLIKSFSVNYGMYLTFEFLEPCLGSGVYSAAYVIVMEILVPKSRAAAASVVNIYFALGQVVMAAISWGLPYWRTFLQVSYAPTILFFVLWWFLDESSRWLLSKKRYDEVIRNVNKVSKNNGTQPSEEAMHPLKYNAENKSKFVQISNEISGGKQPSAYLQVIKSKILVVRVIKCSFWWITCTFCFYGLSINAVALSGTFHLNFMFVALVEIPAHLLGLFGMSFIGRKWTIFIAFVVGGLANFSFVFTPDDPNLHWVSLTSYLIGKLFVTIAFGTIYLYTSELYPTNLRHSLLSFCSMIGRVGSILAPQTPLLEQYLEGLPSILFGSTCIISALLMLTSPETLHLRLPENIEEAENLSSLRLDKNKDSADVKNP